MHEGQRIGFICDSPAGPNDYRLTCFFQPTPHDVQDDAILAAVGEDGWANARTCDPSAGWVPSPPAALATFESLSLTPSIDGGPGSWHGYITNGQISNA